MIYTRGDLTLRGAVAGKRLKQNLKQRDRKRHSPDTAFETKYERIGKAKWPFTLHGMARWDVGWWRVGRRM